MRDKIADTHPLRLLTKLLGKAFGVDDHDLYISNAAGDVSVELTEPISIVVPVRVNEADQATRIFALARVFAYVARGQQALLKLGPAEARLTVAALAQKYVSAHGVGFDAESLDHQARRILKAVSWRAKKAADEAVSAFAYTPGMDPRSCLGAVEAAAVRAAALLAGDLGSVAAQLGASLKDKGAVSAALTDLLAFWASDAAFSFRRDAALK